MKNKRYYASQYGGVYETQPDGAEKLIYRYLGDYFKLTVPDESVKRVKVLVCVFAAVLAAMFGALCVVEDPSARVMYMSVPYAVMLLPLVFIVADAVRFAQAKREMTEKSYDTGVVQMRAMTWWYFIMACLTVLGSILHFILNSPAEPLRDILFCVTAAVAAGAAFCFILFQNKNLKCERIVNRTRVEAKERGHIESRWG